MSQCFKCKLGVGTVVSRDGPKALYCTDCFLRYCTAAVRDNLFQQCCLPCDTPVAVAVSGGSNSMMLLRELGQLRRKTQDQYRRQHRSSPSGAHNNADSGRPSSASPSASFSSVGSTIALLPFHLCEGELIIPPALPMTPSSGSTDSAHSLTSAHARQLAVERVRSSMQQQFNVLLKLVQQQPSLWVYHDESLDGKKKKKKQRSDSVTSAATNSSTTLAPQTSNMAAEASLEETTQRPLHLFEKGEVRVFQYSDFLPPSYIAEVRHALHVSKLSLTDREALYDRVRQQVLCRAAQRVTDEYRHQQRVSNDGSTHTVKDGAIADTTANTSTSLSREWYHLLVGDNGARCAAAALEAVVTGAGGDGVVHGSAFRGLLHNVVCLRPMRTMLPKETVLCSRLHGISCTYTPALRTETSLRSMQQVIENFVHTMILSFRTMIFNVLNTVQRLEVHPGAVQQLVQFAAQITDPGTTAPSLPQAQKGSTKALPGRTAQQNLRDLRACQPPVVHRTPSALSHASSAREEEAVGEKTREGQTAVQCCVCGCPASAPADSADEGKPRQLEMFAVESAETLDSNCHSGEVAPALDCFVCYACRSLLEAWPVSALGTAVHARHVSGEQQHESESRMAQRTSHEAASHALRAGCSLFQ